MICAALAVHIYSWRCKTVDVFLAIHSKKEKKDTKDYSHSSQPRGLPVSPMSSSPVCDSGERQEGHSNSPQEEGPGWGVEPPCSHVAHQRLLFILQLHPSARQQLLLCVCHMVTSVKTSRSILTKPSYQEDADNFWKGEAKRERRWKGNVPSIAFKWPRLICEIETH